MQNCTPHWIMLANFVVSQLPISEFVFNLSSSFLSTFILFLLGLEFLCFAPAHFSMSPSTGHISHRRVRSCLLLFPLLNLLLRSLPTVLRSSCWSRWYQNKLERSSERALKTVRKLAKLDSITQNCTPHWSMLANFVVSQLPVSEFVLNLSSSLHHRTFLFSLERWDWNSFKHSPPKSFLSGSGDLVVPDRRF